MLIVTLLNIALKHARESLYINAIQLRISYMSRVSSRILKTII
jgi:hypothetical protein